MFAPIHGSSLFYTEQGATNALPVIFLHGFPFSHEMWKEQLQLVGQKYRAISYDIRGHGKTDPSDHQYSVDSHVEDLFALMAHLKISKAVLVGLSMGGYIVLRAMEKKPDAVSALVLCDTKSEADNNEAKLKRFDTIAAIKKNGTDAFSQAYVKNVFAPESFQTKPAAVEMIRRTVQSTPVLCIAGNFLALASRTDTTESLSKIKVPTLIMVGEKDPVTTPANAKSMHERIKGSELVVIPDAAHMSNLENPSVFNEQLLQFISKIK